MSVSTIVSAHIVGLQAEKVTVEVSKLNPPIGGDVEEVTIILEQFKN